MFSSGGVLASTSNRPPWDLNRHGVQEDLFDHFVHQLVQHCEVVELSAGHDYRRRHHVVDYIVDKVAGMNAMGEQGKVPATTGQPADNPSSNTNSNTINHAPPVSYLTPDDDAARTTLEHQWTALSHTLNTPSITNTTIPVAFNRQLTIPRALGQYAAWFDFDQLCNRPLGSADYAALAHVFACVFIQGIPVMSMATRDQARRFIVLVDELYNAKRRLVCSAAVEPDLLFSGEGEVMVDLEGLQFETAVEGALLGLWCLSGCHDKGLCGHCMLGCLVTCSPLQHIPSLHTHTPSLHTYPHTLHNRQ